MGAKKIDFHTVEQWEALQDSSEDYRRAQLIEGEIVHKAAPSADHSFAASKIPQILSPYDRKGGGGNGPGGWWIGVEPNIVYLGRNNGFIHDLAGWRRDKHTVRPSGKRITEKPDWVCEIVSSNRSSDFIKKKRVLHEHQVAHYWILDHRDQILSALRWVEGGYLIVAEYSPKEKARIEPFDELEIDVGVLFGKDED
jgi:Uma2 family endonuclease